MARRDTTNIAEIVRRVVSSINSLDSSTTNAATLQNMETVSRNPSSRTPGQEVNDAFRLPRTSSTNESQETITPRSRNGRFTPYSGRKKEKKAKEKKVSSSQLDFTLKDVCLLPSPSWKDVPRRAKKQNLVRNNLFVDVWSLDKTWSEEQLRSEILMLFKDHIKTVNK
ncbi:Hypothetical predicted protein [Paramuricea clavata]|uniref:Uncharacterized protein n=2 Tax=Paramuricea clavata TaxID=317549 RepID=A0A7D9DXP8_PARCT|nr:Hypothetical predicted protein [Paramuricea clavata]